MTVAASVMPATVTTLPQGTQLPSATSSASTATSGTLTESDFLTLLTTQLENQDPLNPQSPSDFAAELAQFSTASGVQTLNSTLGAGSGVQAANLVGKNVAVSGNALILANGSAQGAFNLSAAASDVQVAITNASGSIVDAVDLGAMGAGNQNFTWNGQSLTGATLPAGTYSYTVNATSASSANTATATPYAVVPVTSVVIGGQSGPMLDLGGGVAPVALSAVQEVY
jgi:flagellar basal-body rod modification protein FlgD